MLEMWFPSKNMITHRQITLTTTSFSIQSSRVLRRIPLPIVEELGELLRLPGLSNWTRPRCHSNNNIDMRSSMQQIVRKSPSATTTLNLHSQRHPELRGHHSGRTTKHGHRWEPSPSSWWLNPKILDPQGKKDFSGIQAIIVEFINDEGYTKQLRKHWVRHELMVLLIGGF